MYFSAEEVFAGTTIRLHSYISGKTRVVIFAEIFSLSISFPPYS